MKTFRSFFGHVPMMQHSLASRLQWGSHLSTGDPEIDAQDRNIFGLVEDIDKLWRRGAGIAEFQRVAARAWDVLGAHFHCEERMLAGIGYPGLAEHAAEHCEILRDLASIRTYLDGGDEVTPEHAGLRLSNFILGVTAGHVVNTDSDYCRYIDDETAKLSTGCA
jgi:hemerythrin-like metal-binding protein